MMQNNNAIILPDPRMRSPDRLVSLEFFDHDLKGGLCENKKQSVFHLGDPRKKHVDFMQDMNSIVWQSTIVKRKLSQVVKSDCMKVQRDRFTNELKVKESKM
jgi:hypothetical protein